MTLKGRRKPPVLRNMAAAVQTSNTADEKSEAYRKNESCIVYNGIRREATTTDKIQTKVTLWSCLRVKIVAIVGNPALS